MPHWRIVYNFLPEKIWLLNIAYCNGFINTSQFTKMYTLKAKQGVQQQKILSQNKLNRPKRRWPMQQSAVLSALYMHVQISRNRSARLLRQLFAQIANYSWTCTSLRITNSLIWILCSGCCDRTSVSCFDDMFAQSRQFHWKLKTLRCLLTFVHGVHRVRVLTENVHNHVDSLKLSQFSSLLFH
jgi:hypothetical protein